MTSAQLDDASFDFGHHLVRATIGFGALAGQSSEAIAGVAGEPAVKGPSVDPVADRGVLDGGSVEHLPHGVVALLNHGQIHQWHGVLLGSVEHKS
jgi:hypothetical protein